MSLLEAVLAIPALLLLALAFYFAFEVFGALLPIRRAPVAPAGAIAVVVPAHNEAATILPTLEDIKTQLRPVDRLIVVADNCEDSTAEVAMRAGAACLIRNDPERRGKGYALQFALDALRQSPPGVVLFVDADCRLGEGAITRIAGAATAADRPAQGLYLMRADAGAPATRAVAEFAWVLLNRVRMSGLSTLFDVCRMTGAGMALPWRIASELDLASGEIVEDLALTAALVGKGAPPVFCPDALITSEFPRSEEGAVNQHARWEHGSLGFAMRCVPGMLVDALSELDIRRAAIALDLAIPPLTVFALLLAGMFVLSLAPLLGGGDLPFDLTTTAIALFLIGVGASWLFFGREALPPSSIGSLSDYVVQKARVYGARARSSTAQWTRTDRGADPPDMTKDPDAT